MVLIARVPRCYLFGCYLGISIQRAFMKVMDELEQRIAGDRS